MKLTVIGSRSDGNAYVLQSAGEALLLEAGLPFKKTLQALDYQLGKVAGCLVSHEHQDHAARVAEYLDNGVRVVASRGTARAMAERWLPRQVMRMPEEAPYGEDGGYAQFSLGGFAIVPFATIHDAAEPTGFYIRHAEMGNLLFATDTGYLPRPFAGLSNVMIEANYDAALLGRRWDEGKLSRSRYEHTLRGHMSIDTAIEALLANDLRAVNNIVLLHLSAEHAEAEDFERRVRAATGKAVSVARPGLEIELNAAPF